MPDPLISSANALLRQCEDVKRDAQHAMQLSGVTAEEVEEARSSAASSPFLQQLRQSTRLDAILSSVTAEVRTTHTRLDADTRCLCHRWRLHLSRVRGTGLCVTTC